MHIGNLQIPTGAILAPMAGVTDACFRPLCYEQHCAMAVSEMVSAKGFLYMNKNDRAVRELLMRAPNEGICALQLFGHEPDLIGEAANQLQHIGFDMIDINMGCPTHKIVGNGDGSALMKSPDLCREIVENVIKRCDLPVTVKIRAGWDEHSINAVSVARRCADAGAAAITVHGRTRSQFYAGKADWGIIADVSSAVKVPVVGNGDVRSGADAMRMMNETGCDAVAIGRAAQGNPWIFKDVLCAIEGEAFTPPTIHDRVKMALRHMDEMLLMRSERGTMLEMRKHIAWYLKDARGCAKIRAQINGLNSIDAVRGALNDLLDAM